MEEDPTDAARQLVTEGAVAIRVLSDEELMAAHAEFDATLQGFVEYRRAAGNPTCTPPDDAQSASEPLRYVLGGFGALANPSSFHNSLVRRLRWVMHERCAPLFNAMHAAGETRLTPAHGAHVIVDRMRILTWDAAIGGETWHRDTTPARYTLPDDIILGGWVNLDPSRPQYLSAVRGTHRGLALPGLDLAPANDAEGFATFDETAQARIKAYRDEHVPVDQQRVVVPPGHLLLFYQELVHEVVPRTKLTLKKVTARPAAKLPEYRLFTGWRLTRSPAPLLPTLPPTFFSSMDVPHLKSDQACRMYPKNYYEFGKAEGGVQLFQWSRRSFPAALRTRTIPRIKDGKVVPATMPSLRSVCDALATDALPYPAYSPHEQAIYRPHTAFRTFDNGRQCTLQLGGVAAATGSADDPVVIMDRLSLL